MPEDVLDDTGIVLGQIKPNHVEDTLEPKQSVTLTKTCPYCKQTFVTTVRNKVYCCYRHNKLYSNLIKRKEISKLPLHEQVLYNEYHGHQN